MKQSSVESTTKIHKISLLFLWKNIHFKIFKQKHKDKRTKYTNNSNLFHKNVFIIKGNKNKTSLPQAYTKSTEPQKSIKSNLFRQNYIIGDRKLLKIMEEAEEV